ncbi:MAG: GntR family transcriptional regulator, partial [Mycobacterium sp.]
MHHQLANGLRDAIRTGRLTPHTRLPSTRVLAADLGVSRRLVVDAYSQLVAEGFLLSRHGSGTRVATVDTASAPERRSAEPTRYDVDFLPGSPDLSCFPRHSWLRALRQGLADLESDAFGYVAPQGLLMARLTIADYLRRTRGVSPIRGTSSSAAGRRRPSRYSARRCGPHRWRWRIRDLATSNDSAAQRYRTSSRSCRLGPRRPSDHRRRLR